MAAKLVLPFLGESINEAVIARWLKKVGDPVRRGEEIAELETDKATMELEAPESGTLLRILVPEGERAHTGDLLAMIGQPGEKLDGEISAAASVEIPAPTAVPSAILAQDIPVSSRKRISPLARKMAKASGIEPEELASSRPGAQITSEDVQRALAAKPAAVPSPAVSITERVPSHRIQPGETRRVMARRMTESAAIPQFSVSMDVEMDAFLAALKTLETSGKKVSLTALLSFLLARALLQTPWLNARFDGDGILIYETINLSVAAATGQGLTVPVLHHLETLSLVDINRLLGEITDRARRGQLTLNDLAGSTFTISNLGMYGVKEFIPLVNPPQAAILGVGAVHPAVLPVEAGGTRHVRLMTLTVSADHRVVDGAQAAEFLACLKQQIETIQIDQIR